MSQPSYYLLYTVYIYVYVYSLVGLLGYPFAGLKLFEVNQEERVITQAGEKAAKVIVS